MRHIKVYFLIFAVLLLISSGSLFIIVNISARTKTIVSCSGSQTAVAARDEDFVRRFVRELSREANEIDESKEVIDFLAC